jgi:hypothetical protein
MLALLLGAFALRLLRLDAQSIWLDESISLRLATASLAEIMANRMTNIHPPLYFVGLKGWGLLAGVTPFSARYLSVLASFLQVAAVYAVTRRWFGRVVFSVWAAALLIALSPLSIIYGQEVRVYAILPLVYLALLALTGQMTRPEAVPGPAAWLLLGLMEWIGLHLHYIVLFVVAYTAGWALLSFYRQKRWPDLRRWFITHLLVGAASLPWAAAVVAHWAEIQAEANAGTFLAEPLSFSFLLAQVWVFHLTGLAGALARPEVRLVAGLAGLCLLLLFVFHFRQAKGRWTAACLLGHWLLPLTSALFVWSVRSFSHPRYIAIYAIGLIPLAAYLLSPLGQAREKQGLKVAANARFLAGANSSYSQMDNLMARFFSALLGLSLLAASLWGIGAYFFDPTVAKPDMRAVARHLERAAGPADLILVPDSDWSFPLEYRGQTPVIMPGLNQAGMWANLGQWTREQQQVWVIHYALSIYDWQGLLPFMLEKAGTRVAEVKFDDLAVHAYQLQHAIEQPPMSLLTAHFDALTLEAAWVENEAPADSAVTAALRWRLSGADGARYQATIRLLDVDGWPLAAADTLLLDENGRPTDDWPVGQQVTTYHILPIPTGMPPLTYTLALGIYLRDEGEVRPVEAVDQQGMAQGQEVRLATIRLAPPSGVARSYASDYDLPAWPTPVTLAKGLKLTAATLDRDQVGPGQSLFVRLQWQATEATRPDWRPRLVLMQGSKVLAVAGEAPVLDRYPMTHWQEGEIVAEHRRLMIPAGASGQAQVVLMLGEQQVALGEVEIVAEAYRFEPPPVSQALDVQFGQVARLVGYDLPQQEFTTADTIPLTLYWQSLTTGSPVEYTVFTHVIAEEGHLIGQHDAPPANGGRPLSGWLAGEFITDRHDMTFRQPDYAGRARIEVGLYDPESGERVLTQDGRDFVYLPVELTIRPGSGQ